MKNKRILVIAVIDVVVFLLGVLTAAWFEHNGFLAFAIGANAIVTFFGSLNLEAKRDFSPGDADIRRAIAIAVVLMYLQLVATFAFFNNTPPFDGLLVNFTTTTGVVIAFYFGSSAFIDARRLPPPKNEKVV